MPLDPTISLQVKTPDVAGMAGGALDSVSKFAGIQNALNQNRLFQQTFAARQRAGQIISSAPDLETGLEQLYKDPTTAPFAGETVNAVRQGQETLTRLQGMQQEQAQSGLGAWMKALPGALADPSQLQAITKAQLSTMSPIARQRVQPAIDALTTSLTDGLPPDPNQARAMFNQRMAGLNISAGVSPESLDAIIGKPSQVDTGGGLRFGVTAPPQLGGGFLESNALGKTLAPTVASGPFGPGGAQAPRVIGGEGNNDLVPGTTPGTAAAPGPAGTNPLSISGPTQQQSEYNTKSGGAVADLESDLNSAVQHLPVAVKRLDIMNQAIHEFQTGGGAEARTHIAQLLQAARDAGMSSITDSFINRVANGSIADSQTFNAMAKPLAVATLKDVAQGTGKVMRSEVDAFLDTIDMNKDPDAVEKILNFSRYTAQQTYLQRQALTQYKGMVKQGDPTVKGLDLSDFPTWYSKQQVDSGSMDLGQQSGGAKGARTTSGGATHRYVPGQGIVPIPGGP